MPKSIARVARRASECKCSVIVLPQKGIILYPYHHLPGHDPTPALFENIYHYDAEKRKKKCTRDQHTTVDDPSSEHPVGQRHSSPTHGRHRHRVPSHFHRKYGHRTQSPRNSSPRSSKKEGDLHSTPRVPLIRSTRSTPVRSPVQPPHSSAGSIEEGLSVLTKIHRLTRSPLEWSRG